MPPLDPTDTRRYKPYDICMEKAKLVCQERGVKQIAAEKLVKIEMRCTDLAGKSLSWDIPAEKISTVVNDLCPPPQGKGGSGMMGISIRGSNPGSVPSGSAAFIAIQSVKGMGEAISSSLGKLLSASPSTPSVHAKKGVALIPGSLSEQVLQIYGQGLQVLFSPIPLVPKDLLNRSIQNSLRVTVKPVIPPLPVLPKVVPMPIPIRVPAH